MVGIEDEPAGVTLRALTSLIAPDALIPCVEASYDLKGPLGCRLVASIDNDHYVVSSGADRYVLRVYPLRKDWLDGESDYRFELEWLDHLRAKGSPVAYPIRRRDGGFLGSVAAPEGRRYVALFSFAPGESTLEGEQRFLFGRSIANIHLDANDFRSPHRRAHFDLDRIADRPLAQIRDKMGDWLPDDLAFLTQRVAELKAEIESVEFVGDEYGVIGGDFHGSNHHFDAQNRITHFDFDLCGYGWRVYDLAVFRALGGDQDDVWHDVLAGYESLRPLSDRERRLIPAFAQLREVWFMGIRTTYPASPTWTTESNWVWKFGRLRRLIERLSIDARETAGA